MDISKINTLRYNILLNNNKKTLINLFTIIT